MAFMMSEMTEWSPKGKNFTFGAKTTSCLHPATGHDVPPTSHDYFELPDWMEARNNLGLANIDLFEDVLLSNNIEDDIFPSNIQEVMLPNDVENAMLSNDMENVMLPNDVENVMLPNDIENAMLSTNIEDARFPNDFEVDMFLNDIDNSVLSNNMEENMQHKNTTEKFPTSVQNKICAISPPQSLSAKPGSHTVEAPKITINLKRIKIPVASSKNTVKSKSLVCQLPTNKQNQSGIEEQSPVDTTKLLDELAQFVERGQVQDFTKFDSSMVEDNIQDLLNHLEVPEFQNSPSEFQSSASETSPWSSPFSLPSPVPSCGSLSPPSSVNEAFNVPSPRKVEYGLCKTPSYASASPCYSLDENSQSTLNGSYTDDTIVMSPDQSFNNTPKDTQTEMHSYSQSYKKRSKKSGVRATPYPESKKERKKEQNKQAALRYRHKKKQEDDVIMAQIEAEEERQKQLKMKYSFLKQELACMKKIMREVFIKKGVISADAFTSKK